MSSQKTSYKTADEALEVVRSGDRVYVHEAAMAPTALLHALARRAPALEDVEVTHLHVNGPAPHVAPELAGHLRHNALFVGPNTRQAVAEGRADFTPVFLSEIPGMFRDGTLPIDVALVQVSPPNGHGYCRLGLSVACARAAVDNAKLVIGLVNDNVPLTLGNTSVHHSRFTHLVRDDHPLPTADAPPLTAIQRQIASHAAALVEDGSTLQMGIGGVPNAILAALESHKDLGVHTEMFSDGLLDLIDRGVITNRLKSRFPGRVVTSFAMGSRRLYDFVDHNPFVEFHGSDIVNDPYEIARQHRMVAINSALEIDLTGQVCADSIGTKIHSGIGGQMDFMQGAARSPDGRAIIALPSTAAHGRLSRIVPTLSPGAGVVTTRGHVQWVVTEYGAVNLRGRSLAKRAELLISIAHPAHQDTLREAARARNLLR